MPISDFLLEKWEAKLYNWWLWRSPKDEEVYCQAGDAAISSIWTMDELGTTVSRSGYREMGKAVLSGDAGDTDALMIEIRAQNTDVFKALVVWIENDGTRGSQAARLATNKDTFKDRVDAGVRALERLSRGEESGLK